MTDSPGTAETAPAVRSRGFVRRILYPVLVVVAIAGVIWWLDYRQEDAAPGGEEYGPRDLPQEFAPAEVRVQADEGSLAPDFLLETLDGNETRLSDYRGSPVILNFWATWCRPCRQEMPQFVSAFERYEKDGLVVIGLNLQEGRSLIEPFADDYGMEFPVLIDRDGEVGDRYRLLGLPTTFFIDSDGVIQSIFRGPLEDESDGRTVQGAIGSSELDRRIAQILPAEADDGSG